MNVFRFKWGLLFFCAATFFALEAKAEEAYPCPTQAPPFKLLRYEEDYRYLSNPTCPRDYLDAIKFVPLKESDPNWYFSGGGEIRERFEAYNNFQWGIPPQADLRYLLQRYMLHADLHLGPHFRLFTQFKSGLENFRAGGPRSTDEDKLDLNQAFIDGVIPFSEKDGLTMRLGRQEMIYGSQRFISIREGSERSPDF